MLKETVYTCDHIHITAVKQLIASKIKVFVLCLLYILCLPIYLDTHTAYIF